MCHILISPRRRAHTTFHLLFGDESQAPSHEITNDVREWEYGDYEGLTTKEIVKTRPGWDIFKDGCVMLSVFTVAPCLKPARCPGGESPDEITARIDRVIAKVSHYLVSLPPSLIGDCDALGSRNPSTVQGGRCRKSRCHDRRSRSLYSLPHCSMGQSTHHSWNGYVLFCSRFIESWTYPNLCRNQR